MNEELKLIDGFFNKGWCCDLDEVYKAVMKLQRENQRLKNNWNELKKYTYRVIETDNELYGTWLLQEMKRLESSVDNE